ncbi:MAG: ABC transporter substrate-binding protein [Candidatus Tectomicrobia bacterium]|nr:ABC transporter substrate-binding protein [Candidatus Tectomicrobia bacterium]
MHARCAALRITLVALTIAVMLAAPSSGWSKLAGKEVTLGMLIPLTGPLGPEAIRLRIGANLAVQEINASGGIGGLPIRIIEYDTRNNPGDGIRLIKKLAQEDKVLEVIGPLTSTECEIVFPIANQLKIVATSPSAAAPGIGARNRPWAFRTALSSEKLNRPLVKRWVAKHGLKTAVIITDSKDRFSFSYGTQAMPPLLEEAGVKILDRPMFVQGDVDFSAHVTKIKTQKPDALVVAALYTEGSNIVREVRRQQVPVQIIGGIPLGSAQFITLGGEAVENAYVVSSFWDGNPTPFIKQFIDKFIAAHPQQQPPNDTSANAYDTVYITKKIIEAGGVTNKPEDLASDREKIRRGWESLKDYPGVGGTMTLNKDGDAEKEGYLLQVRGGKFNLVD